MLFFILILLGATVIYGGLRAEPDKKVTLSAHILAPILSALGAINIPLRISLGEVRAYSIG
jgi:hypothetical protein